MRTPFTLSPSPSALLGLLLAAAATSACADRLAAATVAIAPPDDGYGDLDTRLSLAGFAQTQHWSRSWSGAVDPWARDLRQEIATGPARACYVVVATFAPDGRDGELGVDGTRGPHLFSPLGTAAPRAVHFCAGPDAHFFLHAASQDPEQGRLDVAVYRPPSSMTAASLVTLFPEGLVDAGSDEPPPRLAAPVAATATATAAADDGAPLVVAPVEGGSWASQIAALERAPRAPGVAFHVRVLDSATDRAVPCGRYRLALDARGSRALALGRCDESSATEVALVDRGALFEPGDPVPEPQPVAIRAVEVREGLAAGGAVNAPTMQLRCTASVRPVIEDLLHGGTVALSPDRYRLEPLDARVHAGVAGDGWTLSSAQREGAVDVGFRVVDLRDAREVVRSHVTLGCGVATR